MTNDLELSKMFHEIKNPLTLIISSLQLIEKEHPEVQDFRFWTHTMSDLQNLRLLIDDLSAFQKDKPLQLQKISLFDFTEEILESMEGFLLENGTLLTINSSCELLDFYADKQLLRRAVINLLKNAVESSPAGLGIKLSFSANDQFLSISVSDRGCGISEEFLPTIWEPFTTTKSYGTGLGLPIVKKIAEAHHGSLSIHSREGAGTTVTLYLPLSLNKNNILFSSPTCR